MPRIIPISLTLLCPFLSFGIVKAQDFEPCIPNECEIINIPKPNCTKKIAFIRLKDPACEASWAASQQRAQLDYQNCQIRAKITLTRCEALRAAKNDTIHPRSDGEICAISTDCESGYCMPGPSPQPATSTIRIGNDNFWYCVNASANCALPNTGGGFYGDRLIFENEELMCQNPGKGLWAQYYSQVR